MADLAVGLGENLLLGLGGVRPAGRIREVVFAVGAGGRSGSIKGVSTRRESKDPRHCFHSGGCLVKVSDEAGKSIALSGQTAVLDDEVKLLLGRCRLGKDTWEIGTTQ